MTCLFEQRLVDREALGGVQEGLEEADDEEGDVDEDGDGDDQEDDGDNEDGDDAAV